MARTVRIVCYAVNGSGVGHLTRLVAVSRWMRRYAAHAGVRAEIWFLTSSEADSLLFHEGFASFKLPSKTVVGEAGIDKLAYLSLAKQWVWHSLGLLRPDLFVVDTFPTGSFGELLSALDLCKKKAFVYRPMKASFAERPDFQAILPLYDAIVVPEAEGDAGVLCPPSVAARVRYTGPVLVRERVELRARAQARADLGVGGERLAVYVSAGGGGDPGAADDLASIVAALEGDPSLHLVVAAGPLYRGRPAHREGITWLARPGAAELMLGLDLAVCAAGYNSFGELMHAGVPAVFLPQPKIADEQDARAARAVRAGAAVVVDPRRDPRSRSLERGASAEAIRAAVACFRDPDARAAAEAAARALVPENHARQAARELLRLVLGASELEAAAAAVDDRLLERAARLGLGLEPFIEAMHALDPVEEGGGYGDAAEASDEAASLLELAAERGVPISAALRVAAVLGKRVGLATPAERAGAARALLRDLGRFDDWPGAVTLLKMFGQERELGAEAFAAEVGAFLAGLERRGEDLYRGIARLAKAQGTGAEVPKNHDLLAAAGDAAPAVSEESEGAE